jgi:hypothetical protein
MLASPPLRSIGVPHIETHWEHREQVGTPFPSPLRIENFVRSRSRRRTREHLGTVLLCSQLTGFARLWAATRPQDGTTAMRSSICPAAERWGSGTQARRRNQPSNLPAGRGDNRAQHCPRAGENLGRLLRRVTRLTRRSPSRSVLSSHPCRPSRRSWTPRPQPPFSDGPGRDERRVLPVPVKEVICSPGPWAPEQAQAGAGEANRGDRGPSRLPQHGRSGLRRAAVAGL